MSPPCTSSASFFTASRRVGTVSGSITRGPNPTVALNLMRPDAAVALGRSADDGKRLVMQCTVTPAPRQPVDCGMRHRGESAAVARDNEHRIGLSSGHTQGDDRVLDVRELPTLCCNGAGGQPSSNTFTITPSGELSIACRLSARLTGPAGRQPTKTNTFVKSGNAFGVCGAAIIATLSALDMKHSLALPGDCL